MNNKQLKKIDKSIKKIDANQFLKQYLDREEGFTIACTNYFKDGYAGWKTLFIRYRLDFAEKDYLLILTGDPTLSHRYNIKDYKAFETEFLHTAEEDLYMMLYRSKNLTNHQFFTLDEGYRICKYLLDLSNSPEAQI